MVAGAGETADGPDVTAAETLAPLLGLLPAETLTPQAASKTLVRTTLPRRMTRPMMSL